MAKDQNGGSVSLREYFESLFHRHEKRHDEIEAHRTELRDLLKQTVDQTQHALAEFKAASNEWRTAMKDREGQFAAKTELKAAVDKMELAIQGASTAMTTITGNNSDKIKALEVILIGQAGAKAQGIDFRTTAIATITAFGAIAAIVFGIYQLVK